MRTARFLVHTYFPLKMAKCDQKFLVNVHFPLNCDESFQMDAHFPLKYDKNFWVNASCPEV